MPRNETQRASVRAARWSASKSATLSSMNLGSGAGSRPVRRCVRAPASPSILGGGAQDSLAVSARLCLCHLGKRDLPVSHLALAESQPDGCCVLTPASFSPCCGGRNFAVKFPLASIHGARFIEIRMVNPAKTISPSSKTNNNQQRTTGDQPCMTYVADMHLGGRHRSCGKRGNK